MEVFKYLASKKHGTFVTPGRSFLKALVAFNLEMFFSSKHS